VDSTVETIKAKHELVMPSLYIRIIFLLLLLLLLFLLLLLPLHPDILLHLSASRWRETP